MKLSNDPTERYLVRQSDQTVGPYTTEALESLVYLGKLTPDSLISPEGRAEFVPVRDSPLAGRLFPRLQASAGAGPKAWGRPGQSDRHDLKEFKFGETKFKKVNSAPGPKGRIDVRELLGEVRQAERDAGRDFLDSGRFKISKRSRDFWFMVIAGNAVFFGTAFFMQNTISWVFAIAGSGLFTWGLIWSMFGVMDRY